MSAIGATLSLSVDIICEWSLTGPCGMNLGILFKHATTYNVIHDFIRARPFCRQYFWFSHLVPTQRDHFEFQPGMLLRRVVRERSMVPRDVAQLPSKSVLKFV